MIELISFHVKKLTIFYTIFLIFNVQPIDFHKGWYSKAIEEAMMLWIENEEK